MTSIEKVFVISKTAEQEKLMKILSGEAHKISDNLPTHDEKERKRSEDVLREFLFLYEGEG